MNLCEAIHYYKLISEKYDIAAKDKEISNITREGCLKVSSEYAQIVNWLSELKERRAADVQPVKRGKWLQHGKADDYFWCCSACKKWIIYAEHDLYKHHYCGNCGADMRGEDNG